MTRTSFLVATAVCGVLAVPAWAQTVDVKGNTAGATALTQRGATKDGKNSTAGDATASPDFRSEILKKPNARDAHIVPKATPKGGAGNVARLEGDQSANMPGADLRGLKGPDADIARRADADAHRAVFDPNSQRGGAVGHTLPVPGVNVAADADTDASVEAEASVDAKVDAGADAIANPPQ